MKHPKPTEREIARHCARVYLAEARRRRDRDPSFAATLLQWARNARNRSNERRATQGDLFLSFANITVAA